MNTGRHDAASTRSLSGTDAAEIASLRARLRRLEQENLRLLDDERARQQETKALAGIGRLLSERLEPDVVGQRIAESLRSLLDGRSAVVYRIDTDTANLLALAVSQETEPGISWRPVRPVGSGALGLAIRDRRTVTTPDALVDARVEITPELRAHLEKLPDRAVLAVPLLTQHRLIGVLAVRNVTGTVFDARAVQLAETLADQAALTLEQARLFAEQEQRRREAEVQADLARTIGAGSSRQVIVKSGVFGRVTVSARPLCFSSNLARVTYSP